MGESMTDISSRAVAVIRIAFHDDRSTTGAIAFVGHFIKAGTAGSANALGNGSLDIFLRHIVLLCFRESQFQAHVAYRVSAAHAGCNRNFFGNLGGNSGADGIGFAFLTLNISHLECPDIVNYSSFYSTRVRPEGGRG